MGPLHERHQGQSEGDGDQRGHDLGQVEDGRARAEDRREVPWTDVPEVARPRDQRDVLEHGRQPHRGEDLNVVRGVDHPAHDQAIDHQADDEEQRDRDDDDEVGIGGEGDERPEGEVHAEHQELAVGEVHHAHDAEDQGEPHRDEGVDAPQQDCRDDQLGEDAYLRWSQAPSGIHFARSVVNSSGHTVTSCPFCHCSM